MALRFAAEFVAHELKISSITVFELVQGAAKSPRVQAEMAK
jgi:predicted nucleic acid-binding protein